MIPPTSSRSTSSGAIDVFSVNSLGETWERRQNAPNDESFTSGNWSAWASVQNPGPWGYYPLRSIQAFADSAGRINLLGGSGGNMLFQQVVGTTGWAQVPGSMYGGFAATMIGDGLHPNQMFGVDLHGNVFAQTSDPYLAWQNGAWEPGTWSGWSPVGGVLRSFTGGPEAAPALTSVVSSGGQATVTWTDLSTNEDGFAVFRVTPGGTIASEATDYRNVNKAGAGDVITFTDATPNPQAPCYQVDAYDDLGSFISGSSTVCP
jgi:hypothetical protein